MSCDQDQQAGKGLLLLEVLLKIYGEDAGLIPSSTDQVLGRFNDALVGVVYIFLDEVMFLRRPESRRHPQDPGDNRPVQHRAQRAYPLSKSLSE